jgi:hypothetical protein
LLGSWGGVGRACVGGEVENQFLLFTIKINDTVIFDNKELIFILESMPEF